MWNKIYLIKEEDMNIGDMFVLKYDKNKFVYLWILVFIIS